MAKLYLVILTYKQSKLIILNFFLWTNLFLNFLKKELESKFFCTKGLTPNYLYLESKNLHLTLNDLYFRIKTQTPLISVELICFYTLRLLNDENDRHVNLINTGLT